MSYGRLKGLQPGDFEHPGEKAAMDVLRKIPLLDIAMAKYLDMQVQLTAYAEASGNYFRITEKTNPRIYNLYKLALERLDMPKEYPLFSKLGYEYNASAVGADDPFIFIHSSTINDFSDAEILSLLGHELGHIKCGHVKYYGLARNINSILARMGGVAPSIAAGLQYAIMDWDRKAEYSADRAGLIAAGDINGAVDICMDLLGRSGKIENVDFSVDEVLKQAEDFDIATSDVIGKLLYVSYTMKATHPWSILRLKQIKEWYDSGEYTALIDKFS